MNQNANLHFLFEPRSIAVVGASDHPGKVGYKVLSNIITEGYRGKIYPVNPRGGELLGLPCYRTVEEIPDDVDVAIIIIPAQMVFDAVKSCVSKHVKFLPIITSGFSEIGNIEDERKIMQLAKGNDMRVLGPNIFGYYSAAVSLNATFGPKNILPGEVAIITQSGALGVAMMGKTAVEAMGLSSITSIGNKTDIDEADVLEYLANRNDTKIIMMYMEGVKNGERLVEVLKKTTRIKPVVVIKSGRSRRGAAAAASHTGSLAGSDEVFDHIMKQCHVLRAETVEDALAWCKFISTGAIPRGENTIILTNGGGIGVMATDACEKFGVQLYDNYPLLQEMFAPVMPYFGSAKNPVDLTGQASAELYDRAFKAALARPEIHTLISLYCETAVLNSDEFIPIIENNCKAFRHAGKSIVFCLFGGKTAENCVETLRGRGVPIFNDPYEAVSCIGAMYRYKHDIEEMPSETERIQLDLSPVEEIIALARNEGRRFLHAHEAARIAAMVGIALPQSRVARDLEGAIRSAEEIGYPVVMKVISRDILHKSDVGGIALDLDDEKEVVEAYEAILHNCRARMPNAFIEGVEVAEMVKPGTEMIVGARYDPSFGPTVMAGMGGIYVEVMKEISFRSVPLDKREALEMVKETKAYPLLLGVRGEERKDIEALVDAIIRIGEIIKSCAGISDIEVNPLRVYPKGVKAVDVRVLLSKTAGRDANE